MKMISRNTLDRCQVFLNYVFWPSSQKDSMADKMMKYKIFFKKN